MLTNDDLNKIDRLIEKRVSSVEKRLNKKLDLIISFFDKIVVSHTKRIDRLEKHTGLPPFE